MAHTLCAWFPDWPLRRPDAPPDRPCFVVERQGARQLVVARNALAAEAGVQLEMVRREAEVLCPGGVVLERDPGAEALAFEPVIEAIEELVPRVEVVEPGLFYLSIGGAFKYYGGVTPLSERVSKELERVAGDGGRVGVARGPFAARWAARTTERLLIIEDDVSFLAQLGIDTLGVSELVDTFRWLGLHTLGDLSGLPRAAMASRFGQAGLEAHRIASGEDRHLAPREVISDIYVEEKFEEPLDLLEQVGFAARTLAVRLMNELRHRGTAPHRVVIVAEAADGTVRERIWRSADPFTERDLIERVWWQLRAWIESAGIPGGLARLTLTPADISGDGRQLSLMENTAAQVEAERAVARAQALVGPDSVLAAHPQGGRRPDQRVRWSRWGEERSEGQPGLWPGATPAPSPSLVVDGQTRVEVEWDNGLPSRIRLRSRWVPVLSWAGPWRQVGEWWRGDPTADRYQLVTSAGAFLCEVVEGETYLVGVYD